MNEHEAKSLSAIGRLKDNADYCTADLMFFGANVYGLNCLEKRGLVSGVKVRKGGKWWRITDAGREALEKPE